MFSYREEPGDTEQQASVYERVLGADFADLDPQLQAYCGKIPAGFEGVGTGTYQTAGLRARVLWPVFRILGRAGIAFAERGTGVPFTVRNSYASDGTLHAVRTFAFRTATRRMTDRMSVRNGRLVDQVGTRGAFQMEFDLAVVNGELRMRSRRIALCVCGRTVPLPPLVSLTLRERTLSREQRTQHVDVRMTAPLLGDIYGYSGTFTYQVQAQEGGAHPVG